MADWAPQDPSVRRGNLSAEQRMLLARLAKGNLAGSSGEIPSGPREEFAPLSYTQHRIWFLEQVTSGTGAYNLAERFRIKGALDLLALQEAFRMLVARHDILRTVFREGKAGPQAIVVEAVPSIELLDLGNLPNPEEVATERAGREAQCQFDLRSGPLVRAVLFKVAADEHILVVVAHHIVFDGWSMSVAMRELASFYTHVVSGAPTDVSPLPIQYADYSRWQIAQYEGGAYREQLTYWKGRLHPPPPALALKGARKSVLARGFSGGLVTANISLAELKALKALAARFDCTLFMLLNAAFSVLLNRYTGQSDITIGSPVANRTRTDTQSLIGALFNTIVTRVDLRDDPSFSDLLLQVRKSMLNAFAHQELPFEKLVEEVNPPREGYSSPLFQVLIGMQNSPANALSFPGLTLIREQVHNGSAKFDLSLVFEENEQGLSELFEYNADVLTDAEVRRMAENFRALLRDIQANCAARISQLQMLSPEEFRTLSEWGTGQEYPVPGISVSAMFGQRAALKPDSIALVWKNSRYTYRQINDWSDGLACKLRGLGAGLGSRIGIHIDRTPEMIVAMIAVMKAGACYVPLDPEYPPARLQYILEDCRASIVMVDGSGCGSFPNVASLTVNLDECNPQESAPLLDTDPDGTAYIFYTSGSTGRPKGVEVSHRNAMSLITWSIDQYSAAELDGVLATTSMSFDLSIFEIFVPLCSGGKVILASSIRDLAALEARDEISLINTVPSAVPDLMGSGGGRSPQCAC